MGSKCAKIIFSIIRLVLTVPLRHLSSIDPTRWKFQTLRSCRCMPVLSYHLPTAFVALAHPHSSTLSVSNLSFNFWSCDGDKSHCYWTRLGFWYSCLRISQNVRVLRPVNNILLIGNFGRQTWSICLVNRVWHRPSSFCHSTLHKGFLAADHSCRPGFPTPIVSLICRQEQFIAVLGANWCSRST